MFIGSLAPEPIIQQDFTHFAKKLSKLTRSASITHSMSVSKQEVLSKKEYLDDFKQTQVYQDYLEHNKFFKSEDY